MDPPRTERLVPDNVSFAIGRLEAALAARQPELTDNAALRQIFDSGEEVVQRFSDEGYEWRTLQPHERYTEDLQKFFLPFGRVTPDDPLVLLEPALLKDGKLARLGRVRAGKEAAGGVARN